MEITCSRCGQTKPAMERVPFPGEIGQRIVQQICADCWGLWLKQQTMLINHYGLNVMDPQARSFLKTEHAGVPVQVRRGRRRRHVEEGDDSVVSAKRERRDAQRAISSCAQWFPRRVRDDRLADRRHPLTRRRQATAVGSTPCMATLSPRDRAAQLVWPQLFGDYTPTTSASWTRIDAVDQPGARRRLHHVDRLAHRDGRKDQRHAASQHAAAGRRRRLRDRRRHATARRLLSAEQHLPRRRNDVSAADGARCDARHLARLSAGTHHRDSRAAR